MMYNDPEFNDLLNVFFFGGKGRNYSKQTFVNKNSSQSEEFEINQNEDGAYCFFNAPGFNKTNLKVEMENGILYIEGKRTYKLNAQEKTKTISQQFTIGDGYNASSIEATIEDGLLTVFIPNFKKQDRKRVNILQ